MGASSIDRLDAPFEWGKSQQQNGNPDLRMGEIPATELSLRVKEILAAESDSQLLLNGKNPISRVVTPKDLNWGVITH